MNKPIKITFVLPTLQAGGAERVVSYIAQNINKKLFEVTLVVTGSKDDTSYELESLKIVYLNKKKVRFAVLSLIFQFIRNPSDIIFSSLSHLNTIISFISILFPKKIFIARETYIRSNTPGYKPFEKGKIDKFIESRSFKLFDYVICQSQDMLNDTKSEFNINDEKLKIIQNPITDGFCLKDNMSDNNAISYKFITVGRLAAIKGHLRLLKVLSKFKKPFKYTLIGDGPLKTEILERAKELGILEKIDFIPFSKNVRDYLSKSDYFLQGSYTEGFPNALLESCAVGTPVIAFSARGGTKEIIENGVNGYLVNTEEEFLDRLNNLPELDPKEVSQSVYNKFDKAIILKKYEDFFMEAVKNK
ncbi:glycosyltransferase [Maribacter sp. MMG018]|uniref:glycosyltransferase n=1 Tax=Maribacter sp. MMG018 TaxID=2822688 RepID=UPI001B372660|nr:glycosyltransferase [Maribacter sp. MMG018]MBQ4915646.1 glycosyltransferase [Maribacter sp. MMG018]